MLDNLCLRTTALDDGSFLVDWKFYQGSTLKPRAGSIRVSLHERHTDDRAALAELRAAYYLFEERAIHGTNRLGNGVGLIVDLPAIRKALRKDVLKTSEDGKDVKRHVGAAAGFLATKYFEVTVKEGRWPEHEAAVTEPCVHVELGVSYDRPTLPCPILNESVAVSRHAMLRQVGRIDQQLGKLEENDLRHVPDARWSAAWRWFRRALDNPQTRIANLLPKVQNQFKLRYGDQCHYLYFESVKAILVIVRDPSGLIVKTVIATNPYRPLMVMEDRVAGQKVLTGADVISRIRAGKVQL